MRLHQLTDQEYEKLGDENCTGSSFTDIERSFLDHIHIPWLSNVFSLGERYKRWLRREAKRFRANAYYEKLHELEAVMGESEFPYIIQFYRL